MHVYYDGVETLLTKGFKRLTPFFVPFIITNMGGAILGIDLGFMGPNYSISTACATANYSIYSAAAHIARGEADLMVCGGAEAAITPLGWQVLSRAKRSLSAIMSLKKLRALGTRTGTVSSWERERVSSYSRVWSTRRSGEPHSG